MTGHKESSEDVFEPIDFDGDTQVADAASGADKRLSEKDLSPDQKTVYDAALSWASRWIESRKMILTIGGLAGTGKSTLLGVLANRLSREGKLVAYATYTGRAASVLQRKLRAAGVETTATPATRDETKELGRGFGKPLCSTIHALLYRPIIDTKTEEIRGWEKRTTLDRDYALIVIDEASMVSDEILEDIQCHGVPLLAVGDHGQLPPVMARGDLVQNPDLRLEKIHRQALDSPIIALAHHVRQGGRFANFKNTGDAVRFVSKYKSPDVIRDAFRSGPVLNTGVICWTNKTRVAINRQTRKALGRSGYPRGGEPVMCLRNQPPVYNGMRGLLTKDLDVIGAANWLFDASARFPEEGLPEDRYRMCVAQFNREKTFAEVTELSGLGIRATKMSDAGALFDFAYAATCHKMQGSSLAHAILYVDRPESPNDRDWQRWAYTGITRAAERLTVVR